jgi:hypothetical protein
VIERFTRQHIGHGKHRDGRRAHAHDTGPDVSFRWRSESLGSRRVAATHDVD